MCLDLLGHHDGLLVLYGAHLLLPEALLDRFVVPQVELRADEDDRHVGRVVVDLGVPLHGLSMGGLARQRGSSPWP